MFFLTITFLLAVQFSGAMDNYCHDQQSWDEWEALVQKYPNDMDVHTLHALRLGLCVKVERGDLTVEEATGIFERARERILQKKGAKEGVRGKMRL